MSLILELFLPAKCLFCDELGDRVCGNCAYEVGAAPRIVSREGFIGFSATDYNMASQKLLRSYKELGESELAGFIAGAMFPLLQCFEGLPDFLVPMPSNRSSLRERGYNPAELLAREIAARLPRVKWSNLLSRVRETQDQSKLNPIERKVNQLGSMVAKAGSGSVIIVDDVVTTGASVLTAKQTLENAGYFVQGFVTFAETEGKRCTLTTQAQLPADGGTSWN